MAIQSGTRSLRRSATPFTCLGVVLALLGFGLVLVVGTITAGKTVGQTGGGATKDVVVAASDIAIRTPIDAKSLKIAKYATADVPPAAFSKVDDLKGLVAGIQISSGQPLTANLLVKSGDSVIGGQGAYLTVPTGFVALTIPTGEQQGVAGFVQPGDYLSLVAIVKVKTIDTSNTRTIYTNVHVLRVGPASADASASGGPTAGGTKGGLSSSLTIVVTQCQAEYITWFLSNETLKYTLESYKDYKPQDTTVDASCPSVTSAGGVHESDIRARWPGIANP